jgi:ribosomal protein S18 acetylase RimI-like enzyme
MDINYKIYRFNMVVPGDEEDFRRVEIVAVYEFHIPKHKTFIVGHISLDIFDKYSSISWIYVDSKYRKTGIASELLKEAWKITKENNLGLMGLVVEKSSVQMKLVEFYEKRNFLIMDKNENDGINMFRPE